MASIFLIDDHVLVRGSVATALEGAGHVVLGGHSGDTDPCNEVSRLRPEVVLLDLNLGCQSGLAILARLQRMAPSAAVVVLTMSASKRDLEDALKSGAKGYVLKGAPMPELLGAIDSAQAGQQYLCAQSARVAAARLSEKPSGEVMDGLSMRERQILIRVARGSSSAEIANALHLSPKTVESYCSRLMTKVGAGSVAGLVRFALANGLFEDNT